MSSIGPQLPPHLTKRKRSPEDESPDSPSTKTSRPNNDEIALDGDDSDSDDGYGPSAPKPAAAATAGPQRPSIGPTLPATTANGSNADEIALNSESDDDTGPAPPAPKPTAQQPRRVMGPAPPPADLATRPTTGPNPDPDPDSDSDSDSEDDYGPALPGAAPQNANTTAGPSLPRSNAPVKPAAPRRDDWMLAPPEPTGYQERDPTKIKARKFASGASATSRPQGGGGGISAIWTETPEEKAKRLADAVLGRGADEQQATAAAKGKGRSAAAAGGGGESKEQQDKIRAFTEQTRGKSMYEEHQAAKKAGAAGPGGAKKGGNDEEEDDDPSKRAFDREKDMGLGMKITASQRKELLNRASDFGGRFQKGNYL